MSDPWGISGPEFVQIYLVALLVALLLGLSPRILAGRRKIGDRAGADIPLTVDKVAYLAGGRRRVAEAAVARLVAAGALRASRDGRVAVTGKPGPDRVAKAVLNETGCRGNHRRPTRYLIDELVEITAIGKVREDLERAGLLVSEPAARRASRFAAIPLVLVLVAGIVRLLNGMQLGRPVGWLFLLIVVNAVLLVTLLKVNLASATQAGKRALAAVRRSAGTTDQDNAVALFGFSAYPDAEIRSALRTVPKPAPAPQRKRSRSRGGRYAGAGGAAVHSNGSSCSSSSCSSGSSCGGGGGCGGGGCGG